MISRVPLVMPDGNVYLKGAHGEGGNLTGQMGTAHDNTLMMLFVFCYCYAEITGENFQSLQENCAPICLGDDCTFTVSNRVNSMAKVKYGVNYGQAMARVAFYELGIIFESPNWEEQAFHKLGFLSMHFKWDVEHQLWFHVVDTDKLWSSLLQGGTTRSPDEQVQRIANMRNVCWGDLVVRKQFEELYERYVKHWDPFFQRSPDWEQAKKSFVPNSVLERLFCGFDSRELDQLSFEPDVLARESSAPGWTNPYVEDRCQFSSQQKGKSKRKSKNQNF